MDGGSHDGFSESMGVKLEPLDEGEDIKPNLCVKRERNFGSDPFSESEERIIRQKLDVGLSRNETMQRPGPGGCRLTYIEGWKVIHDANQIFGFNGWSSRVVTLDLRFVEEHHNRFSACVCATVRITLRDGSYREDRGGGAADNMRSKGDAILKAEKEAVTDATKRALKNFGLRLGLSLYDRQHVREMNKPQQQRPATKHVQTGGPAAGGAHTPQASRPAPGSSHHRAQQPQLQQQHQQLQQQPRQKVGYGTSPVTPGLAGNGSDGGVQFAAQRELALKRKQAFLQAKAAAEGKAKMQMPGTTAGGNAYAGGGNGSGFVVNAPGAGAEMARRQQEIDELSRMALADF